MQHFLRGLPQEVLREFSEVQMFFLDYFYQRVTRQNVCKLSLNGLTALWGIFFRDYYDTFHMNSHTMFLGFMRKFLWWVLQVYFLHISLANTTSIERISSDILQGISKIFLRKYFQKILTYFLHTIHYIPSNFLKGSLKSFFSTSLKLFNDY